MDSYLRRAFVKGVPPIFVDLKPLYESEEKVKIIEDLCLSYLENLKAKGTFTGEADAKKEPITALLWLYYYLGQHYDFKKLHDKALDIVNTAIDHTPTLIELYLLKAKIYKVKKATHLSCTIISFNSVVAPWGLG